MGAYITRRLLWTVLLLWVVSGITFIIFNVLPSADPALLRAGRRAEPEILAGHPRDLRARPAALRAVLGVHEGRLPALRLRAVVPQRRRRAHAAARPAAEHAVPGRRRRRRVADHRPHGRHDLRRQARLVPRPLLDDARARRDLRAGLLARPRRPLPLLRRHRALPALARLRRLPGGRQPPREGRGADHAVVRARDRVRGGLRATAARQPARGPGRGLHPHRARQGPAPSAA